MNNYHNIEYKIFLLAEKRDQSSARGWIDVNRLDKRKVIVLAPEDAVSIRSLRSDEQQQYCIAAQNADARWAHREHFKEWRSRDFVLITKNMIKPLIELKKRPVLYPTTDTRIVILGARIKTEAISYAKVNGLSLDACVYGGDLNPDKLLGLDIPPDNFAYVLASKNLSYHDRRLRAAFDANGTIQLTNSGAARTAQKIAIGMKKENNARLETVAKEKRETKVVTDLDDKTRQELQYGDW